MSRISPGRRADRQTRLVQSEEHVLVSFVVLWVAIGFIASVFGGER
jgi:hypothetical protein